MPTRAESYGPASRWLAVAVLAAVAVLYWPTFELLNAKWGQDTSTYSHGYLIAAVCVWLVWRAAGPLPIARQPAWLAIAFVLLVAAGWLFAVAGNVLIVQALAIPAIAFLALVAVFGIRSFTNWIVPVGYFLFAVPLWDAINPVLQGLTIAANSVMLGAMQIPAYIDGSFVQLAAGTFEIASGCSGLHFFIVAVALAVLYGHLNIESLQRRVLLVGVSMLFAIVMNWIRVTTIIVAGHVTDMQHYLVTVDHYVFGWVLFAIMLVPLMLVARRIEGDSTRQDPADAPPAEGNMPWRPAAAALVALAIAPAWGLWIKQAYAAAAPVADWPASLGDWRYVADADEHLDAEFAGPAGETFAVYSNGEQKLRLYANLYTHQSQGAELIGSDSKPYDDTVWRLAADEASDSYRVASITSGKRQRRLAYWYRVGGTDETSSMKVKISETWLSVTGRAGSGIRVVAADCGEDCAAADGAVRDFIESHRQAINDVFVEAES